MYNTGFCGLFVIMYYLLSAAAAYFTAAAGKMLDVNMRTPDFRALLGCISSFVSGFFVLAIYFLSGKLKSFRSSCLKKPELTSLIKLIPVSCAVWLCGMFLNMIINKLAYDFFNITTISQLASAPLPKVYLLNFLNVCIIAPVTEELFFRGALFDSGKEYGNHFAAVFSAIMFTFAHGSVTIFGLPLVMGIVSAVVLIKTGCIFYCIFIHALCNGASFVVALLPQSEKLYFAENMFVLICGSAILVTVLILKRKEIVGFLKNVFLQSRKFFSSASEIIALTAIILYYIYSNYSLHFLE